MLPSSVNLSSAAIIFALVCQDESKILFLMDGIAHLRPMIHILLSVAKSKSGRGQAGISTRVYTDLCRSCISYRLLLPLICSLTCDGFAPHLSTPRILDTVSTFSFATTRIVLAQDYIKTGTDLLHSDYFAGKQPS